MSLLGKCNRSHSDVWRIYEEVMIGIVSISIYIILNKVIYFYLTPFVELNKVMCLNAKRDKTVAMLSL